MDGETFHSSGLFSGALPWGVSCIAPLSGAATVRGRSLAPRHTLRRCPGPLPSAAVRGRHIPIHATAYPHGDRTRCGLGLRICRRGTEHDGAMAAWTAGFSFRVSRWAEQCQGVSLAERVHMQPRVTTNVSVAEAVT